MKNSLSTLLIFFTLSAFLCQCKIPYYPPVTSEKTHFFVVEGFIRSDSPTIVKLSYTRTVSQYDSARTVPENNATVIVEDDHANSFPLNEIGGGVYSMDPVFMDSSYKYRLHIFTKSGKEYASDFVPFKKSPPIDNIDWATRFNGVEIYANTHNAQNTSRYYRWQYIETWEFHAPEFSHLVYDKVRDTVLERTDSDQVHVCWNSDTSSNIILGTTENKTQDIMYHQPLIYIEPHDIRLSVFYSIIVTQYALDSTAYNFWQKVKKNTENLGSIFDAQPIQITGNIHCLTDTSEIVIGFIGAGTTSQRRVFIKNSDLPPGWWPLYACQPYAIPPSQVAFYTENSYYLGYKDLSGVYIGYYNTCANCSLVGSTVKPSFWP